MLVFLSFPMLPYIWLLFLVLFLLTSLFFQLVQSHCFSQSPCPWQTALIRAKYSLHCSPYSCWSPHDPGPIPPLPIYLSLSSMLVLFYNEDGGNRNPFRW
jgi:hypothetical protein